MLDLNAQMWLVALCLVTFPPEWIRRKRRKRPRWLEQMRTVLGGT